MEYNRNIYNKICGNIDIDMKLIIERNCKINSTNQNENTTKIQIAG
jgi:hypothetical protein